MTTMDRWRGLVMLVADAVEHGSRAIERVHKETAQRPFGVLERIPPIALPAKAVHAIHDATVGGVHGAIRLVNRAVSVTVGAALDVAEHTAADATRDPVALDHDAVEHPD